MNRTNPGAWGHAPYTKRGLDHHIWTLDEIVALLDRASRGEAPRKMKPKEKRLLQLFATIGGLYVISFACVFEVFSSPVRNEIGWLGPRKRFNPQSDDIGKVYYYTGTDMRDYRLYRPLCLVWIWVHGLN